MRGLFVHLGHPDGVTLGVEIAQRRCLFVELIAQDQYQVSEWVSHRVFF